MEPREAAELLALMRGTWPRLAPDEVADRLWLEDLIRCDKACALEAFRGLRDHEPRTPSWASFRDAYEAQRRRKSFDRPALTAAADEPPTAEQRARVHDLVADLTTMIATKKRALDGKPTSRPATKSATGGIDPLVPMASYGDVYGDDPGAAPSA